MEGLLHLSNKLQYDILFIISLYWGIYIFELPETESYFSGKLI